MLSIISYLSFISMAKIERTDHGKCWRICGITEKCDTLKSLLNFSNFSKSVKTLNNLLIRLSRKEEKRNYIADV